MEKWQESRNYRRIKGENGEIIANIITVDGVDVEVTEEVYLAYSQMDRRDRYLTEDAPAGKILSLDQMKDDSVQLDYVGADAIPSAEDSFLENEDAAETEKLAGMLLGALISLKDEDRQLITALFYDHVSTRAYARRIGVTQHAVIKRRDRILRDMKKFFEKFLD